jgi:nitrogen fixation protein FixH
MPKYTTQQHHSKKTHTHTKQQTQNIESHPTRKHQHVLYEILKKIHKPNSTTNKSFTKQHNINTESMATTL